MDNLVTVIVPIYNVEKYLDMCIQSILNQIYKNLEILLIDDGSTDSSYQICQRYAKEDSRIKVIKKKNSGLGATRNVGIEYASGQYIYFLDSDDYIEKDLFSTVIPYMSKNKLELCYFSANIIFEERNENFSEDYYYKKNHYHIGSGISIFKQLYNNKEYTCSNCLFIISTDLIKRNNLWVPEGIIFEDNFFSFQLSVLSKRSGVINQSFYNRRIHAGSIMTQNNKMRRYYGHMKVIEDIYTYKQQDKDVKKIQLKIIKEHLQQLLKYSIELHKIKETLQFVRKYHYFFDVKVFFKIYLYYLGLLKK